MIDYLDEPILEVTGLNIFYGSFQAVRDVSFAVKPGEIFGLLGPNGAGKTSTLSAVEGLLKPQSGRIMVAGFDSARESIACSCGTGCATTGHEFSIGTYRIGDIATLCRNLRSAHAKRKTV